MALSANVDQSVRRWERDQHRTVDGYGAGRALALLVECAHRAVRFLRERFATSTMIGSLCFDVIVADATRCGSLRCAMARWPASGGDVRSAGRLWPSYVWDAVSIARSAGTQTLGHETVDTERERHRSVVRHASLDEQVSEDAVGRGVVPVVPVDEVEGERFSAVPFSPFLGHVDCFW